MLPRFAPRLLLCLALAACADESATNEGTGFPSSKAGGAGGGGSGGKGEAGHGGSSASGSGGKATAGTGGTGGGGKGGSAGTGGSGGTASAGGSGTGAGGSSPFGGGGEAGQGGTMPSGGQGGQGGSSGNGSASGGSSGGGGDPFEQARQTCIDTINMYRSTLGLSPMSRRTDQEMCVDAEADHDATVNMYHDAFVHGMTCGGSAQNECPGFGDPISGIQSCLSLMWSEKERPVCKGCDGCDFPYQNCTDCTFFGTNGTDGCGHYLNMKSQVLSQVACGFSDKGWFAQNYY